MEQHLETAPEAPRAATSRRRYVRLPAPSHLHGRIVSTGTALSVADISEGGFAAFSDTALAPESRHVVELRLGDADPLVVRVEVVHCLLIEGRGCSVYRAGFRFIGRPRQDTGTIEDLIDRLLAPAIAFL